MNTMIKGERLLTVHPLWVRVDATPVRVRIPPQTVNVIIDISSSNHRTTPRSVYAAQ
jgi:hypothetical protein